MPRARFMTNVLFGITAFVGLGALTMTAANAADDKPVVVLDTTLGPITIELDHAKAPITVDNFLKYVDDGFYNNLIFHRVISDFMIQGGGMNDQMQEKPTRPPIKNESGNGLSNTRGTIAMARTNNPNSATAQFFINLFDTNSRLDTFGGGYTVFGKVTSGMDVVDAIAKVQTGFKNGMDDVPLKPIYIKSAKRKAKS
ncbi:peptidyl-prolyl cis-trans isomerase A (cyclophilin A) [Singulisphaera sp. GP187]|nr:peptidylprolyl isomerase [Singulisphaera sp. GP187]SIO65528.1 peptidyl-prolyl cis-trans isomerase A (cyclophilin A) [Singulisphaera sp. GP187]